MDVVPNLEPNIRTDDETAKEYIRILKGTRGIIANVDADLNRRLRELADVRERPILVCILGSSILNREHCEQLESVIGNRTFENLDFIVQSVVGDINVGFDIANMVRSRVKNELTTIDPTTLSGQGTLMSLSSNNIIGSDFVDFGPPDMAYVHPSITCYNEIVGRSAPMYYDNKKECLKQSPEAIQLARELLEANDALTKGHLEELLKHLTSSEDSDPEVDYYFPELTKLGVNAMLSNEKETPILHRLLEIMIKIFSDRIFLIN